MTNDEKVKQLVKKAEQQKDSLGTKPKAAYVTNGLFKYPDGQTVNLNVVTTPVKLIEALAWILRHESYYVEASKRLGITEIPTYFHDGYSVEDWTEDFKTRLAIINYENRKKVLEKIQKALKDLMSVEGKTAMELEKLEALLK